MKQPQITKQDATVIVLELITRGAAKLFDERFDNDPTIAPDNLLLLRNARDKQIERLHENLRYARKAAG